MNKKPKLEQNETTIGVANKLNKTINMKELVKGLALEIGDIILVDGYILTINEIYDFVDLEGRYNSNVPNVILGMVSGKHSYKIYKLHNEIL